MDALRTGALSDLAVRQQQQRLPLRRAHAGQRLDVRHDRRPFGLNPLPRDPDATTPGIKFPISDLQRLIEAWPVLPTAVRHSLLTIIDAVGGQPDEGPR